MNSFRLRLALLVGAITAALLFAVGFFAWQLTTRFNLDRLDRELRNLAKANLERIGDRSHWARVDDALAFVSGPGRPLPYVLWVKNYDREEYRSARWPAGIAPEKFPAPNTYEGGLTFTTPPPPPRREQISSANPALPSKEPYFLTASVDGSTWRIGVLGNPYSTLVLAANLDDYNLDLSRLRRRFFAALPLALLVVGGGAWFLASRALRPVTALTRAAEGITERGLDRASPRRRMIANSSVSSQSSTRCWIASKKASIRRAASAPTPHMNYGRHWQGCRRNWSRHSKMPGLVRQSSRPTRACSKRFTG